MQPTRIKVAGLTVAFVALSLGFKLTPWFALGFLGDRSLLRNVAAGLLALTGVLALTVFLRRRMPAWVDGHWVLTPPPTAQTAWRLLASFTVGALLFAAVFLTVVLTGGLHAFSARIPAVEVLAILPGLLAGVFLNAAWEEFTFRGWAFAACVKVFGRHTVALLLGTVFGLMHMLNPNWSWSAILSIMLAGWLLSYSMLAFRNMDVVIGLHVGWNLVQSLLTSTRFWTYQSNPNPLLSGGDYGLEASSAAILITGASAGVAVWLARKTHQTSP